MSFTEYVIAPFIRIFNSFIRRTEIMGTIAEIKTMVGEISTTVDEIDTGLDEVAALIADLKAGQVGQAEIDALAEAVEALKAKTAAVAAETGGLKA